MERGGEGEGKREGAGHVLRMTKQGNKGYFRGERFGDKTVRVMHNGEGRRKGEGEGERKEERQR